MINGAGVRRVCTLLIAALLAAAFVPASILAAPPSPPFNQCPALGADTSCSRLIFIDNSGATVLSDGSQGPFDTIEDTLVGVLNTSGITIPGLPLTGSGIFGFDGDGVCGLSPVTGLPYVPRPSGCPFGATGYEGPGTSFSITNANSGTVNFAGSLAPGQSRWFTLEGPPSTSLCIPTGTVTLSATEPTSGHFNDPVTFTAHLTNSCTGAAVSGATLTFTLDGQSGVTATTDASGNASATITPTEAAGTYTLTVSFAGSSSLLFSSATASFTVTKEDDALTFTTTSATTGHFNDAVTVSATLVDPANAAEGESSPSPIAGKTVTFSLNGTESCTGTTNATGVASCTITPKEAAGTYTLNAHFAGDAFYQAADVNAPFVVTKEDTNLSSQTSLQVFIVGATATLSSTLVDPANTAEGEASAVPIANPVSSDTGPVPTNITMTLGSGAGSQSCTAPTNASGVATCSFTVSSSVGNGFLTITDSFTDSTNHFASATNTQKALVAAFPDHGSFEIGDVTEDSASPTGALVNWWGPSHWKTNSYSALPAGETTEPNQMKGFIETPASFPPTCGTAWTSDPGNSSNPPATVPAYMATIVASTVGADGSVITGNTVEIVVIQTNLPSDEYAPGVGNEGTGPIVAEVCPSNGPPK